MSIDLERLFMICIVVSIAGSIVGGIRCAIMEKQIFGKADTAGAYKPKRLKTSLISLGTSSILGYALSEILLDLVPTGNSTLVIAGSFIALIFYYFVHAFVYAYLLRGE